MKPSCAGDSCPQRAARARKAQFSAGGAMVRSGPFRAGEGKTMASRKFAGLAGGLAFSILAAATLTPAAASAQIDLSGVYMQADIDDLGTVPQGVVTPPDAYLDADMQPIAAPPLSAWGAERARWQRENPENDPTRLCMPLGTPRSYFGPYPIQIVQRQDVLAMLFEFMNKFRIVYLDERVRPDSTEPSFRGRSTGRWDGDVLVVTTTDLSDQSWLQGGTPKSDELKLEERITLREDGQLLEVVLRIDDPKAYTAPWHWRRYFRRVPWELAEFNCEENNRSNASDYDVLKQ